MLLRVGNGCSRNRGCTCEPCGLACIPFLCHAHGALTVCVCVSEAVLQKKKTGGCQVCTSLLFSSVVSFLSLFLSIFLCVVLSLNQRRLRLDNRTQTLTWWRSWFVETADPRSSDDKIRYGGRPETESFRTQPRATETSIQQEVFQEIPKENSEKHTDDMVKVTTSERVSERIWKQVVDVPVPKILESGRDQRIQNRQSDGSHFGSSHFGSRSQVLSLFFWFSSASFVSRLMGRRGWSTMPVPEGWVQVIRGPRPKSVQWPRAPKGLKHQQQRQPGATQQGRWRQPHVQGRQGQPQAPKTGIRAPHPDEKVAVAQERVSKLEAALRAVGDDDDTAPNLREALKRARQQAVPLSIPDKVAQCESFLERARKREAAARELLLQAQTELTRLSAEVVEGEQRLATLRAELERPSLQLSQSTCPQRCRGCVL